MRGDWRTVSVFISSTFRDMQAERDYLVRFVFPRLREELARKRIRLVDVDLRWGLTDDQDTVRRALVGITAGIYAWNVVDAFLIGRDEAERSSFSWSLSPNEEGLAAAASWSLP